VKYTKHNLKFDVKAKLTKADLPDPLGPMTTLSEGPEKTNKRLFLKPIPQICQLLDYNDFELFSVLDGDTLS